jgi:hypothetical protein
MKFSYIFVFGDDFPSENDVAEFVKNWTNITTWRKELPNTYFIVSEFSASRLYSDIEEHFSEKIGTFIISEYSGNSQGRLHSRSWFLLNNKKLPPKQ